MKKTLVIEIPVEVMDEDYFRHTVEQYLEHAVMVAARSLDRQGAFDTSATLLIDQTEHYIVGSKEQ